MEYIILLALVTSSILSLFSIVTSKHMHEEISNRYTLVRTEEDLAEVKRKKFMTNALHGCINVNTICILYVTLVLFGVIV